ncbi:MAG: hypothetical protein LBS34_02135 [Rickettsiales bacterium]|jgi:hypothetical protein|nr:hypothetical protein [Rickettsiales bacterium]
MYIKLSRKLIFYRRLLTASEILAALSIMLSIFFCLYQLFFLKRFNRNSPKQNTNIVLNVVEKPTLQINKGDNIIQIMAERAEVEKYKKITIINATIKSKSIDGFAKSIVMNEEEDEIVMTGRPYVIFYGE